MPKSAHGKEHKTPNNVTKETGQQMPTLPTI